MAQSPIIILNPAAGGGRAERRLTPLAKRLGAEVWHTSGPQEGAKLALEALERSPSWLGVAGGDGTLHEVVAGLAQSDASVPVALLPVGSGNSFARDFGITSLAKGAQALHAGRTAEADIFALEHADGQLPFVNILSFGFSAEVAALTNARFKAFGALGYALGVSVELTRFKAQPIACTTAEGTRFGADPMTLVAFSNSRCTGGGMQMAPAADACDGRIDLVEVRALSPLGLIRQFPGIYRGTHVNTPFVRTAQSARIDFDDQTTPTLIMVDGEVRTVVPHAIYPVGKFPVFTLN